MLVWLFSVADALKTGQKLAADAKETAGKKLDELNKPAKDFERKQAKVSMICKSLGLNNSYIICLNIYL